jgi:hypothetical protein
LGNQPKKSIAKIESALGTALEHWRLQRNMIHLMTHQRDQRANMPDNRRKMASFRIKQRSKTGSGSTWNFPTIRSGFP